MSTNHTQSNAAAYTCLRVPALLLAIVGLWGIANEKVALVANISASFKLPPVECCYVLMVAAAILYGISLLSRRICCKTPPRTSTGRDGWRNC